MTDVADQLPGDLASAHAMILAERAARREAQALAARAQALNSHSDVLIARLRLEIEKLKREIHGSRSERKARLLQQMELQLEELEADASQDELAAELTARSSTVRAFERKRPSRKPFPDHLPRERVVIAAPRNCPCCGSGRLAKLGEDITETLEVIPRQWKVIQTVREKFTCRECEKISQPPASFHVTPRGFAGPNLLAMVLFEKFAQHQPLNRQSERYAREGVDLSLSTLADQVGACAVALKPVHALIEAHVLAADRLHADDTTVPILAKGKTDTGRIWTYVRDDRPFGGQSPPAALYYASRDRRQEHPKRHLRNFTGILQADAYGSYNPLFKVDRDPSPLTQALCWAHARRKFFVLADIAANAKRGKNAAPISPIALEAVKRIDALFGIERDINGLVSDERLQRRQESRLIATELEAWMRAERARLSRSSPVAEPIDYMLKRWEGFTTFLGDGRICLTNNAAERALRGFALGRKAWLFAGSDRGADRAAFMATLINTAKLNGIDPQAWLADVLACIADTPITQIEDLLPWNWSLLTAAADKAA
ncbi:IS66 family transposase [Mesorhizobium sp. M4B.F.Ca.ET.215.01.1.1]|uniref:IS66 family transposase n=1 Tax=Mesorhizobium sp. TaxID=1871066 RepID=UPI000FC9A886|nr:IS66 family transposase [Mesorhizobium sp. M4A.F.Ca.ET.090.04.2.1]RVD23689.1 IS66 family transposase [Mesorhizobium sp. M4B.F.Ca.ET.017.02.2.1]RWB25446.1 MAG: IS66 family transposase [Mesorhizobium sp.]TGQ09220.1 IS66 family transposase [Mesorhizobium sp. M4B.F.Ca.ET.215.01.1.1]TGQ24109.1 IS66 family transposase [Mesorhizobium sp. M00.F.Ca.ET.220.01.1.1]TGQ96683.1 IS66 family transposase [Mesorhizobium sp. M4B.F.Ca.ET.203.01.1.1]TGT37148.1 IS66 family transposase [Mesorhizobium sp. M4B.F.C